ncbi:MAG: TIGR01440 family protein [Ruminococcaceae bacterium]|nr:TIGR01440 family protein [Oscillospiraceae bacterium]
MNQSIYEQTKAAIAELCEKAKLQAGNIVVVGCSTSEVVGSRIGTNSNPDTAGEIFKALHDFAKSKNLFLAVQCCEHLNRAIITERNAVPFAEPVSVIPQPKAGGSLATKAYANFDNPVAIEEIKADAGLDIGFTLIGMHLKKVAVPLRLENNRIGEAMVLAARTRPKFIGGTRAVYDENMQ